MSVDERGNDAREKGRNAGEESSSNVAGREIASFPNRLCVFWLDWPPLLPVSLATSATPFGSNPECSPSPL